MRRMNVTHFETGPFTGEAARTQGAQTPLVSGLGKGVGLIHELAQLAGAEKLFDDRGHRLRVNQVMGMSASTSCRLMRSLMARSMRTRPIRY